MEKIMNENIMEETNMDNPKKICVLFPGVGYTEQKPLLYYMSKLAKSEGYDMKSVSYMDLPTNIAKDPEKIKQAFESALDQVGLQLSDIQWDEYDEILFIGKSIGTAVAAAYGNCFLRDEEDEIIHIPASYIYLTPLEKTFDFVDEASGIAFYGLADPWSETNVIEESSKRLNIPLYTYEDAKHSLETGDVIRDIEIISDVMKKTKRYLDER